MKDCMTKHDENEQMVEDPVIHVNEAGAMLISSALDALARCAGNKAYPHQYAVFSHMKLVKDLGMEPSMTGRGSPEV
jgi:hypothetical protein